MYEKFKSLIANDTFYIAILLILVGLVSFGLGRESVKGQVSGPAPSAPAGVIFTDSKLNLASSTSKVETETKADIRIVASKSGTKYHALDCPGALQIKEQNKIYFESEELAKAAGYTPAANCPGLR